MSRSPGSRRCVAILAGISLDERNELLERVRRYRWVNGDYQSGKSRERNQIEVLSEFIGDLAVQRGIDHIARIDYQQRVSIGRHSCYPAHGYIAAATTHILDVELFSPPFRQFLCEQARDCICRTAWRVGNDHADGSIGVVLWPRTRRDRPRRRRASEQRYEVAASHSCTTPPESVHPTLRLP